MFSSSMCCHYSMPTSSVVCKVNQDVFEAWGLVVLKKITPSMKHALLTASFFAECPLGGLKLCSLFLSLNNSPAFAGSITLPRMSWFQCATMIEASTKCQPSTPKLIGQTKSCLFFLDFSLHFDSLCYDPTVFDLLSYYKEPNSFLFPLSLPQFRTLLTIFFSETCSQAELEHTVTQADPPASVSPALEL